LSFFIFLSTFTIFPFRPPELFGMVVFPFFCVTT
jgi:hypothetical protein